MGVLIAKKGKNLYSHSCPANSRGLCVILTVISKCDQLLNFSKDPLDIENARYPGILLPA